MTSVNLVPVLSDNYSFVILRNEHALVVDPGQGEPIVKFLDEHKIKDISVLITHHHQDHIGGIPVLADKYNISVICPERMNFTVPFKTVTEGNHFTIEALEFEVMQLPGHTLDHIAFFEPKQKWLFSGDVLFGLGCGRVFEGTYEMMYASLQKIKKLPEATMVYCGHEYTEANCRFASSLGSYSPFSPYISRVNELRAHGKPSVPLSLKEEMKANPFLLTDNKDFQKQMGIDDSFKLFKELRDRRNQL